MPRRPPTGPTTEALDALLEEILVDAYGEDEQLWAFRQVFEHEVELPLDAFVIGEPVSVIAIDYDGNERGGLTARCRREGGVGGVGVGTLGRVFEGPRVGGEQK